MAYRYGCSKSTVYKAIHSSPKLREWAKRQAAPRAQQGLSGAIMGHGARSEKLSPAEEAAVREYLDRDDLTAEDRGHFSSMQAEDQIKYLNELAELEADHAADRGRKTFPRP
jgi:hypothetical protein